jgi:hypothetical protein
MRKPLLAPATTPRRRIEDRPAPKPISPVLVILLVSLLVAPAAAQPLETVEVDSNKTLTGVWKIFFPELDLSVRMPLMGGATLRFMVGETFCRMDQDSDRVSTACLSGAPFRQGGTASLEGKNLHLAWGDALARLVIDAVPEATSRFSGEYGVKFMGIRRDAALPASGERYDNPADTPDTAGKAPLLTAALGQLAAGGITAPHDAAFAANFGCATPNKAADVANLGQIEAIIYLGEGNIRRYGCNDPTALPFQFSAYQVEFTGGQRLCGIHQREDGVIDGFLCV